MPRDNPSVPSYRLHKATGRAVVTLSGHDFYLGEYGSRESSPASWAEYDRRVGEWLASGRCHRPVAAPDVSVAQVLVPYLAFARIYYRNPAGQPTPQLARVQTALAIVSALYAETPAVRFGPLALKAVRQQMIGRDWCRNQINQAVGCVKRAFAWAVSEELIPPSVTEALRTVRGLERGRTEARESVPVRPVPDADVAAVLPLVLAPVRAAIELQLLTGARPGEVLAVRPGDIERREGVWIYRPAQHKTQHHGHERTVFLGPRARRVLAPFLFAPYLDDPTAIDLVASLDPAALQVLPDRLQEIGAKLRDPESYCLSPREAMDRHLASVGHKRRYSRSQPPRDRYGVDTYARAIRSACKKAKVASWHPHRLRHTAATRFVDLYGWDMARILLGQRCLSATRIYGEDNTRRASDVVGRDG